MAIPPYIEIAAPALRLLAERDCLRNKEFIAPLAEIFKLTDEEREQEYEVSSGKIFYDRVTWALSDLYVTGLVLKPGRGLYQISEEGRKLLKKPDENIIKYIKENYKQQKKKKAEKESDRSQADATYTPEELAPGELPPKEELSRAFARIRKETCDDILDTILSKSPREFEKLVVKLLKFMGYGGEIKDAAEVTPYSRDGGIDGIIREDALGLGRVCIQAKRYKRDRLVQRPEVQAFVGALISDKGVFITTSGYTKDARKSAAGLANKTPLVLIDGEQLAKYIYEYGLGMQTEQTLEIKKLDEDFWDSMIDDDIQGNTL